MASTTRALFVLTGIASLLSTSPAFAETTAWVENEGGRMRVTALPASADGRVEALLEIEPESGWITYWREPGGSGIPPQITLSGGASLASIGYPVPKVLQLGTLTDIGYDAPVALPLELKRTGGEIRLDAFIGICKDICIPFQARFALRADPSEAAAPEEKARISAAIATLPAPPDTGFAVTAAKADKDAIRLSLTLPDTEGVTEAILTGPEGYVFTAEGKGSVLSIPLRELPKGTEPKNHDWRVLVKNGGRAIETEIRPE